MAAPVFYDEIYSYYEPPFWQTTWFYIVCAIVAVAVVIGVTLWLVLRRKKTLTPWQWALEELQLISPVHCHSKEDFKKFYFCLTDIIKTYLHKRYAWDVHDKTDNELVVFLEQQNFNHEIIEMLKKIAQGALWVKFANMDALKSQAEADWKTVMVMVERTTPSA
jgi:hypothetical protein